MRRAAPPIWSTSSLSEEAGTSPVELAALSQHLGLCHRAKGRLFALKCHCELLSRFVAGRVITTLLISSALVGAGALLL